MTSEQTSGEFQEGEVLIGEVQTEMKRGFPEYSVLDRTKWDKYKAKEDDTDRGRSLYFYTSEKISDQDPRIRLTFRPKGFTFNTSNSPEPTTPYTIRSQNDSMYGPKDRFWRRDELPFAIDKAKIRMNGVYHESLEFRNQIAGWSETEQRFVTIGEKLDKSAEYRTMAKKKKDTAQALSAEICRSPWSIYENNPEKAKELSVARIGKNLTYITMQGLEMPSNEAIRQINEGTESGRKMIFREFNFIDAYESLLRERNMIFRFAEKKA